MFTIPMSDQEDDHTFICTEAERVAMEEAERAFIPLDTYVHNVRGTEEQDDLERLSMCLRLIMHDYSLGNLLASPNLGPYAERKAGILQGAIDICKECKRNERRANHRLQALLQHRMGTK
jgi:hypothetical protein